MKTPDFQKLFVSQHETLVKFCSRNKISLPSFAKIFGKANDAPYTAKHHFVVIEGDNIHVYSQPRLLWTAKAPKGLK